MSYCSYYQALVSRKDTWFIVAIMRSFEHCAFDRTLQAQDGLIEFFVPQENESYFIEIMNYLKKEHIVFEFKKLPNRLQDPNAEV